MTLDETPQSIKLLVEVDNSIILFQVGRYHSLFPSFVAVDV